MTETISTSGVVGGTSSRSRVRVYVTPAPWNETESITRFARLLDLLTTFRRRDEEDGIQYGKLQEQTAAGKQAVTRA